MSSILTRFVYGAIILVVIIGSIFYFLNRKKITSQADQTLSKTYATLTDEEKNSLLSASADVTKLKDKLSALEITISKSAQTTTPAGQTTTILQPVANALEGLGALNISNDSISLALSDGSLAQSDSGLSVSGSYDDNFLRVDTNFDGDVSGTYDTLVISESYDDSFLKIGTSFDGDVEGNYNTLEIVDGSIINADISNTAAISWTKISKTGALLTDFGGDHGDLAGLGNDDHVIYALLAGRAGGQTLNGGTAANDDLTFDSTTNGTKGYILINPTGGNVGIGTDTPTGTLHIKADSDDQQLIIQLDAAQTVNSFEIYKSDGTTRLVSFEDDGTLVFENDAVVYDDLQQPGLLVRTNASAPDLVTFGPVVTNLIIYGFDGTATLEQVYFNVQLPHSYKLGTDLYPHIHWSPTDTSAGNVVWKLEYSWADVNGTFAAPTTIATTPQATGGTAWAHNVVSFPTISGTGVDISRILVCRLYRDPADAGDTYTHDAALLNFDFHFEKDTLGSRELWIK
ncbi:MAG: hypothetical protein WCV58_00545 [Patescibacteria group bacterium]